MPAPTAEQRDLVRAARKAMTEAREAQQRVADAGLLRDDERLYGAVGGELADVVYELTDLLAARAGVTVRDDQIRLPRSKTPAAVLPVEFSETAAAAAGEDFAYISGSKRVKLTISLETEPAAAVTA